MSTRRKQLQATLKWNITSQICMITAAGKPVKHTQAQWTEHCTASYTTRLFFAAFVTHRPSDCGLLWGIEERLSCTNPKPSHLFIAKVLTDWLEKLDVKQPCDEFINECVTDPHREAKEWRRAILEAIREVYSGTWVSPHTTCHRVWNFRVQVSQKSTKGCRRAWH